MTSVPDKLPAGSQKSRDGSVMIWHEQVDRRGIQMEGKKQAAWESLAPAEIEKRSFEIIEEELHGVQIPALQKPIVKRVIHTTADFDYIENLKFSEGAVEKGLAAIRKGACIVTDTNMVKAGIHKSSLEKWGGEVFCYMSDPEVAKLAASRGCTRSVVCMERAMQEDRQLIFAIGNAPTALLRLYELVQEGKLHPELVIGVPVGFVNVEASKELILHSDLDYIVAQGRKGGSNVAAAICNALLYMNASES